MNLKAFFDSLSNPLNDKEILQELLNIYGLGNYYTRLMALGDDTPEQGKVNQAEKDRFFAYIFNTWKANILSLTQEDIERLKEEKILKNDILYVYQYLRNVPDLKSEFEVRKCLWTNIESKEMAASLERYNPFSKYKSSTWTYAASRYTDNCHAVGFPIRHRLYVNVDCAYVHLFANELVRKCAETKLEYEFKFNTDDSRKDSVVIYCSDENLVLFVKLCEEIKQEHPEMVIYQPPILSARYKDWLGYGAESVEEKGESYNSLRAKVIEEALGNVCSEFYSRDNMTITIGGKKYPIEKYISYLVVNSLITNMRRTYELDKALGYNVKDYDLKALDDKKNITDLQRKVSAYINLDLNMLRGFSSAKPVYLTKIGSREILLTPGLVKSSAIAFFKSVVKNDDVVLEMIREEILTIGKKYGISDKHFYVREHFQELYDEQRKEEEARKRVVASRVSDNMRLYQVYADKLQEICSMIEAGKKDNIDACFEVLDGYRLGMDRVNIYVLDYASDDIHARTQYYLSQMTNALKEENLYQYRYLRNMYENYEAMDKKL